METEAAAVARTGTGTYAAQIAARPDPTARAVPPTRTVSTTTQSRVRPVDGAVSGVAARVRVTTATST